MLQLYVPTHLSACQTAGGQQMHRTTGCNYWPPYDSQATCELPHRPDFGLSGLDEAQFLDRVVFLLQRCDVGVDACLGAFWQVKAVNDFPFAAV